MSFNNINTKLRQEHGFTIVELLIVIVVIGILAAITIVSFNGVTAKANSANAQSAAEAVAKKLEAYNAETGAYPTKISVLTADSSKSYYLSGVNATAAALPAKPSDPSTISINTCTSAGLVINYWQYDGTSQNKKMNVGDTTTCSTTAYLPLT